METDLAHALADKSASATRDEQSHQQVDPATMARGLTPPLAFFSFVVPFIRLVAAEAALCPLWFLPFVR